MRPLSRRKKARAKRAPRRAALLYLACVQTASAFAPAELRGALLRLGMDDLAEGAAFGRLWRELDAGGKGYATRVEVGRYFGLDHLITDSRDKYTHEQAKLSAGIVDGAYLDSRLQAPPREEGGRRRTALELPRLVRSCTRRAARSGRAAYCAGSCCGTCSRSWW